MYTYVDTSAYAKVVLDESETIEMINWLGGRDLVSSRVLEVEMVRAARRADASLDAERRVREALLTVTLVPVTDGVFGAAKTIGPRSLRTLDAIHLATAERLRADIESFVTYDHQLAEAAEALGFTVVAPGAA